jgi:chemotaxis protein CheY-P-specific phosphatase CheC
MINSKASFKTLSAAVIAFSAFAFVSCGNNETSTTESDTATTSATNETTNEGTSGSATAVADLTGTQADTTVTGTANFK